MFKKLHTFLTNFHRPFLEPLETWFFLINQDTEEYFSMFLWDELSMFSPILNDDNAFPDEFFNWYSEDYQNPYEDYEVEFKDD
jgi:hypothetical protein